MFACDTCKKEYKRKDNMLRHRKTMHGEDSSNDKPKKDALIDASDTDESDMESDSDAMEETIDPWYDIIDYALKSLQPEFDEIALDFLNSNKSNEKQAREKAFNELLPKYRKLIIEKYLYRVLWFDLVRKDPIHSAIKRTAKQLKEDDGFESEESWKYAANKRKYLFDKVLKEYNPPELTTDS